MSKRSISFIIFLFIVLIISFCIHITVLYFLELNLFEHKISLSYVVNFLLAFTVLFFVEKALSKKSAQAGFIFMGGSGIKFLFFFILFYPSYNSDGVMKTIEFTSFFVPYAICLILEVAYLSKELNNQTF